MLPWLTTRKVVRGSLHCPYLTQERIILPGYMGFQFRAKQFASFIFNLEQIKRNSEWVSARKYSLLRDVPCSFRAFCCLSVPYSSNTFQLLVDPIQIDCRNEINNWPSHWKTKMTDVEMDIWWIWCAPAWTPRNSGLVKLRDGIRGIYTHPSPHNKTWNSCKSKWLWCCLSLLLLCASVYVHTDSSSYMNWRLRYRSKQSVLLICAESRGAHCLRHCAIEHHNLHVRARLHCSLSCSVSSCTQKHAWPACGTDKIPGPITAGSGIRLQTKSEEIKVYQLAKVWQDSCVPARTRKNQFTCIT